MKYILTVLLFLKMSPVYSEDYQYELSIGAIFQNEAPYLKEWIEFHKLVGVEHFYLFNNCSTDDYLAILQPYIESGEVDLFQWPTRAVSWENWLYEVQAGAYVHCIRSATGCSKWLALIDVDEFLTPISSLVIPDILKDYEEFAGVCFNWKTFGHSWLDDLPPGRLLIESLVWMAPFDRATNLGVKSIVRPEYVETCKHPHYVVYKEGFYGVNSNKNPNIDSNGATDKTYYDRLVVNHYWSRTGNYLYKKLQRYSIWFPQIVPESWPEYVKGMNEVCDHTMERFVAPLRERLSLNGQLRPWAPVL